LQLFGGDWVYTSAPGQVLDSVSARPTSSQPDRSLYNLEVEVKHSFGCWPPGLAGMNTMIGIIHGMTFCGAEFIPRPSFEALQSADVLFRMLGSIFRWRSRLRISPSSAIKLAFPSRLTVSSREGRRPSTGWLPAARREIFSYLMERFRSGIPALRAVVNRRHVGRNEMA